MSVETVPQGILHDRPPGEVHVVPLNDSKAHLVEFRVACWCGPQTQRESADSATCIHKPVLPFVKGHNLQLRKILVGVKDGAAFTVELPVER